MSVENSRLRCRASGLLASPTTVRFGVCGLPVLSVNCGNRVTWLAYSSNCQAPPFHACPRSEGAISRKPYERRSINEPRAPRRQRGPPMTSAKRPSRMALSNWPVRWKVLAIVLVPLVLAGVFGGFRIYASATDAAR